MTQVAQVDTADRNTNIKVRSWFFTWNNYSIDELNNLTQWINNNKYVIGEEIGKEGTPHLQGTIYFKNARTFDSLHKKWPKVHWEWTKDWYASMEYCKKEGKVHTNIKDEEKSLEDEYNLYMIEEYKEPKWNQWQQEIINIINQKPDKRKVHWYWEPNGATGKSYLAKWIEWKFNTIIVNGKQNDVFNGVKSYLENKNKYPKVVILDIPRTNENYVCYSSMEKIKDGLFYSGKYEGGVIRLLPCHLIVFANFAPDITKMSSDRWQIKKIT